jgi:hypothetical protein
MLNNLFLLIMMLLQKMMAPGVHTRWAAERELVHAKEICMRAKGAKNSREIIRTAEAAVLSSRSALSIMKRPKLTIRFIIRHINEPCLFVIFNLVKPSGGKLGVAELTAHFSMHLCLQCNLVERSLLKVRLDRVEIASCRPSPSGFCKGHILAGCRIDNFDDPCYHVSGVDAVILFFS